MLLVVCRTKENAGGASPVGKPDPTRRASHLSATHSTPASGLRLTTKSARDRANLAKAEAAEYKDVKEYSLRF